MEIKLLMRENTLCGIFHIAVDQKMSRKNPPPWNWSHQGGWWPRPFSGVYPHRRSNRRLDRRDSGASWTKCFVFVSLPRQHKCWNISGDVPFISWLIRNSKRTVCTPASSHPSPSSTSRSGRAGYRGGPWRLEESKHYVPFRPCWLASRCKTKAQPKQWCLVFQLIKRQIRRSPNYPVGNASLAVPREHYEFPIRDLCSTPKAAGMIKTGIYHSGLHFKLPLKSKGTFLKSSQETRKEPAAMIWMTEARGYYWERPRTTDIIPASRVQLQKCWLKTRCFHRSQSLVAVATATVWALLTAPTGNP